VEDKKRAVILAKEAAIRWTGEGRHQLHKLCESSKTVGLVGFLWWLDNYALVLSYFTGRHGIDPQEVREHPGVEESYEDIL